MKTGSETKWPGSFHVVTSPVRVSTFITCMMRIRGSERVKGWAKEWSLG